MQRAIVSFDGRGVPISTQFDDPYFSLQYGLEETRYVFLNGNEIASKLDRDLHIGEIGFGTGLNFFATWQLWKSLGRQKMLRFTSFEAFPMTSDDRAQALTLFPELHDLLEQFHHGFDGVRFCAEGISLELILGDANQTLMQDYAPFDAWYLDGFSPAKNPEAWNQTLMNDIYRLTKFGGTASTYTSAGHVRAKLCAAGFNVSRTQGFGTKRHMTIAAKV